MSRTVVGRAVLVLTSLGSLLVAAGEARAQISPGELSAAHAELEGSADCLECHQPRRGVDPARCLSCHTLLAGRIEAGEGLHARPDHRACERCHIEHHGREFELVWWGDDGRDAFDHGLTGYRLTGAHTALGCRDCHRAGRIAEPRRLRRAGKDLDRTFLGLPTSCAGCHEDPHRGQFEGPGGGPADCSSCHGDRAWSPAVWFDHDTTGFRLTLGHEGVVCASCHRTVERDGDRDGASFVRWAGTPTACADCHDDAHGGRFGRDCASCHSLAGWGEVDASSFDHDRTRFPLRGRHRGVECSECHRELGRGGVPGRIPGFERCETCHADPHAGQLTGGAGEPASRTCDGCHGVGGWSPSTFTAADHQATGYPLEGAHRAVPCVSCHAEVAVESLPAAARERAIGIAGAGGRTLRFAFGSPASLTCADCHRDPHEGEADPLMDGRGCLSCHSVDSWREVAFDHSRTGFELVGPHARLGCGECHPAQAAGTEAVRVLFSGRQTACAACHDDPHGGQFERAGEPAACAACHAPETWEPVHFDHDRDARFPLEGAHRAVACAGCHPTEQRSDAEGDGALVRYRPLGTACSDCHGTAARRTGGARR